MFCLGTSTHAGDLAISWSLLHKPRYPAKQQDGVVPRTAHAAEQTGSVKKKSKTKTYFQDISHQLFPLFCWEGILAQSVSTPRLLISFIPLPFMWSLNQSYSASRMLSIFVTRSWRLLECIFSFSMYVSFLSLPATSRSASTEDFRTSSLTWPSSF